MKTAQIHLGLQPLARQNLNAEVVDAYATTSVGQIPSPRVEGTNFDAEIFQLALCRGFFCAEWSRVEAI